MKRALFVCIGNAGRSQMAKAFYEQLGGEARSAGSWSPRNQALRFGLRSGLDALADSRV